MKGDIRLASYANEQIENKQGKCLGSGCFTMIMEISSQSRLFWNVWNARAAQRNLFLQQRIADKLLAKTKNYRRRSRTFHFKLRRPQLLAKTKNYRRRCLRQNKLLAKTKNYRPWNTCESSATGHRPTILDSKVPNERRWWRRKRRLPEKRESALRS